MYQTAHTLFGTAKEYGAARVRGSSIPEGSIGTVLAIGYCTLKGGRQLLNVTFCTTAHFTPKEPPPGMSWKDWCYSLIELYPPDTKSQIAANVVEIIKLHQFKTKRPIPEGESDPASGVSWKWLCQIINRGDLKGRKQGMLINKAVDACKRLGIS